MRSPAILALGLLWLPLLGCSRSSKEKEGGQRPDVVLFLIDTLRADRTGPGGWKGAQTPAMDALAAEGVVFEEASSAAPWTLPSVASIFTGRHLAEHNVIQEKFELPASLPILPELLADRGYRCANYHRNAFAGATFGFDRGFDICKHIKREGIDAGTVAEALGRFGHAPLFLYIHNAEPHDPDASYRSHADRFPPVSGDFLKEYRRLTTRYRNLTRVDFVKRRPLGTVDNSAEQAEVMAALNERVDEIETIYSAAVSVADMRLGSVIEDLKRRGRWENTLFILLADHGEEMGDHGGWQHDQSVYQELLHVPLIIHFPGGRFAGQRVDIPVSLVDVVPTILETLNIDPGQVSLSGRSLLPLVRGERAAGESADQPRLVGMRINQRKYYRPYKEQRGDVNIAVRDGHWKAILNVEPRTLELYDLGQDPSEQHDLALERPEVAARLRSFAAGRYAELLHRSAGAQAGGLEDGDQETLEALKAMGYLGGEDGADSGGDG